MENLRTKYTILASFAVILIMAITENIRGVLVPTFKLTFGVTDNEIGIFLFLASLAFVVFTYFAGKMVKQLGQKKTAIIGMTIAGTGFLIAAIAQNFIQLVLGFIVLTSGISSILMSLNTIIPLLNVTYFGVIMNLLHFFYGVGATFTQRLAGYMITQGVNWRYIFVFFTGLYLIGIILYSFVKQPPMKTEHAHKAKIHGFERTLVIMFSIALGFYITAEIQTSNWLVNYLKEMYQYTEDKASFYIAFFFGALAMGRLVGGYILEKIGYLRGVIGALIIALILYVGGLVNEQTLILLSLSGFFFSIVYPTTILVLQRFFEHNVSRVVSIVTMAASGISMLFAWVIGVMNNHFGVRITYFIMPLSLLISVVFMIGIAYEIKKVENIRKESEQ